MDNGRKKQEQNQKNKIRLNKYLSNAGVASRREADSLIQKGLVKVNGKIIKELGVKIDPAMDEVYFRDKRIQLEKKAYILLNKPKDCITTVKDPQNRKTVLSLLPSDLDVRMYPVGRLDRHSTGLLLLTNDGELAKKLMHPSGNIEKIYAVRLSRPLTKPDFEKLQNGVPLDDGIMKADSIAYLDQDDKSHIGVEIHSGKNRVIRRMFKEIGYHVYKLDRVVYAGLTKKDLPRGKWRYLSEKEVRFLKKRTGL